MAVCCGILQVGKETLHYIATQGPTPETSVDLWRLVWQQRVQVVAMVTQDTEAGKVRCHRYWPDDVNTPLVVNDRCVRARARLVVSCVACRLIFSVYLSMVMSRLLADCRFA